MKKREQAKDYLVHYFRMLASKMGIHWDANNDQEVEHTVDLIVDAAIEEIFEHMENEKFLQVFEKLE